MDFLYDDRAIMKNIWRSGNSYKIEVHQTTDEEITFQLDVTCVCPKLAELAQKIEDGDVFDVCVHVEVLDSELYDDNENKGYAICAYSREPLNI